MLDSILITGDRARFNPNFGKATVIVPAAGVALTGTGIPKINNQKICVVGDEKKVIVVGCSYTNPPHITPGLGILSIQSLATNQKSRKVKSTRKAVLLKGNMFNARFKVTTPAQTPTTPPTPDPMRFYPGTGYFTTTNRTTKGSW